ncbi:hypothetical protein [Streptomyces sp. NPDC057939]|uniref:hypothetical protein n=1 Tax=Streptomyces sp. NPDC057939 TaxID=3346284 RepID=UPI0036E56E27
MTTLIPALLLDSLALTGGAALTEGFALEARGAAGRRALLRGGSQLEAYDLDRLWDGERAPVAAFPFPWPDWSLGQHSVAPDASFAVFSGQRSVRAVAADGTTLWVYRHGCWDQRIGHGHSGDDQQVCGGIESGSCRVSDDGALVWAHVVADAGHAEQDEYDEYWVVLDATDGAELARVPLTGVASGSQHVSHPDGVHMGLCIGMGQDGILLHWARLDGGEVTTWDVNETEDRILVDVHPGHAGFLTVEHYGEDIRLHALDGTVLATAEARPTGEEAGEWDECRPWDHPCGFVDADTVIATTVECDEHPEEADHWLLDARTLTLRGGIAYPCPVDGFARPLGDGTWLTHDGKKGLLHRWGLTLADRPSGTRTKA